jgi:hypothetical protein
MDKASSRSGPAVRVIERMMRRTGYLEQDERILEWKQEGYCDGV